MQSAILVFIACFAIAQANDTECNVCKAALVKIVTALQNEETQILGWANNGCKALPTALQAECQTLVTQYGKTLLDMIINQLNPDTVCKKFCASSKFRLQTAVKDDCTTCKAVVQKVDGMITDDQATIITTLDSFCDSTGLLAGMCKNVVNQYGPQVIASIVAALDPTKICSGVGVC